MKRFVDILFTSIVANAAAATAALALTISGQVRHQANGTPVSGVSIDLLGPITVTTQTDGGGNYSFSGVAAGTWTIQPRKVGDQRSGITSWDSLAVLQSLAGARSLNSSQQWVCDVSGDGVVAHDDAVQILQLKVQSLAQFAAEALCASSFLFVPFPTFVAGQQVTPPSLGDGACTVGAIALTGLSTDATGQDFEAVLIGDCTEDWPGGDSPLPTLTRTPTRTGTATQTPTRTQSGTPTTSSTVTRTSTSTRTATRTPTRTATSTPSRTPSRTATRTPTQTPTRTGTPTRTLTPTRTPHAGGPQISLGTGISGFASPVHITHAGDGSGRLFVVEQEGMIRIVRNGSAIPTPFLDLRARTSCCGEQGLLSVAFPPGYGSKRYFYVNYTDNSGNTAVSRFRLTADDDVADVNSEERVLSVAQPFANHNGGQIAFGPDGYLYIGMGDGGSGNDPQNLAQNYTTLLGKMLRIDVEAPTPTGTPTPYQIPTTNPTPPTTPGARREIWAAGLRNPWRFSFDRLSGDLYIADVGQGAWEEVDFQPAASTGGENYGWRIMEGTQCTGLDTCNVSGLTLPVAQYDHSLGCSITGGHVYRGAAFACIYGTYFYGDFCSGRIWGLRQDGGNWVATQHLDAPFNISSFGEDETGALWVADLGGTIYPLLDACVATPTPTPTSAGFSLRFHGNGVGDVDRVKIRIDTPSRPADVSGHFTLEWWMKAAPGENLSGTCSPGGDGWINGNVLFDRDVYGSGDFGDFGVSLFGSGGNLALGVDRLGSGTTICGTTTVVDGNWHHVAATRDATTGQLTLFVDGQLDAQGNGPTGDISYRDGRATSYPGSDPFLVIGAEKHDAGTAYPSYHGWIDEVRLSSTIRYANTFTPPAPLLPTDAATVALYHFDEGSGDSIGDSSGAAGGPSAGTRSFGGSPAGPEWSSDTP